MDSTVSFNQFAAVAEQDGRIFFGVLQAVKTITTWWGLWWLLFILKIFLFIPVLIIAQIVPFIFRKHLAIIFPVLPFIKDPKTLQWLKDAFLLYFYALKGYKTFCFFRGRINSLIDELDEHIDSISFSLEHRDFLQQAADNIKTF